MAAEPLYLYRADTKQLKPVRVACPHGRYPAKDADGETVYANTHFANEKAAWEHIHDDVMAEISLAGCGVETARAELLQANQRAADVAIEYSTYRENLDAWERTQDAAHDQDGPEGDE